MAKVKVKTLIGATAGVLFLTATVAFLFYAFPQWLASATGLGPYDGQRILTFCALLNAAIFLLGWMTEKAFSYAGKRVFIFTGEIANGRPWRIQQRSRLLMVMGR